MRCARCGREVIGFYRLAGNPYCHPCFDIVKGGPHGVQEVRQAAQEGLTESAVIAVVGHGRDCPDCPLRAAARNPEETP